MKQTIELKPSQQMGWEFYIQERAKIDEREARFIGSCLIENGGSLDGSWKWDGATRTFWKDVPDGADGH